MRTHPKRLLPALSASVLAMGALLGASTPGRAQQSASQDKIIVSGASGQLGGLVVESLLARGVPAKNLILVSRTPEELAQYAKQGAATRFGDFTQPESLPKAYAGGTRMLLISIGGGLGSRAEVHKRAIDAAVKAGVKHIAYTSFVAISKGETGGLASDHYQTEQFLKDSGVAWTMLRNSIYSDTLIPQAAKMVAEGRATVPADAPQIGYVTREDCAESAAAVLSSPGHENKAYDITGPELIGPKEVAAMASAITGKPIEVVQAQPAAQAGPRAFDGAVVAVVSDHVKQLTGEAPTSVRELLAANREALLGADK